MIADRLAVGATGEPHRVIGAGRFVSIKERDLGHRHSTITPPEGRRPKRLVEYLRHMQRIAALTPAPRIAYPGHGEPVLNVADLARANTLGINAASPSESLAHCSR